MPRLPGISQKEAVILSNGERRLVIPWHETPMGMPLRSSSWLRLLACAVLHHQDMPIKTSQER
jgi:hypothetical protein